MRSNELSALRTQNLLHDISHIAQGKRLAKTGHTGFLQELARSGTERITSKEDHAVQESPIAALKFPIQTWAIDLWHADVTED